MEVNKLLVKRGEISIKEVTEKELVDKGLQWNHRLREWVDREKLRFVMRHTCTASYEEIYAANTAEEAAWQALMEAARERIRLNQPQFIL